MGVVTVEGSAVDAAEGDHPVERVRQAFGPLQTPRPRPHQTPSDEGGGGESDDEHTEGPEEGAAADTCVELPVGDDQEDECGRIDAQSDPDLDAFVGVDAEVGGHRIDEQQRIAHHEQHQVDRRDPPRDAFA